MMGSESPLSVKERSDSDRVSRRQFLSGIGTGTVPILAGCLGDSDGIDQGINDFLVQNYDSRERTITVEVTKVNRSPDTTPQPEDISWEREFTVSIMPDDHTIQRDFFDEGGWYYIDVRFEDGGSFNEWAIGCIRL